MNDPRLIHAGEQLSGAFGSLGQAFGAFVREAIASGATRDEAYSGARAAVITWVRIAMSPERPDT